MRETYGRLADMPIDEIRGNIVVIDLFFVDMDTKTNLLYQKIDLQVYKQNFW